MEWIIHENVLCLRFQIKFLDPKIMQAFDTCIFHSLKIYTF